MCSKFSIFEDDFGFKYIYLKIFCLVDGPNFSSNIKRI